MNYLMISPYYPPNFQPFASRLKEHGVTVLGIGEEPYDQLGAELQRSLTEYFRVNSLADTDEVKRAAAFLFYKHGPIDRVESHNEHWLELDAELRLQFNIPGSKPKELRKVKYKSEMKKLFKKAGVPVVPAELVYTDKELDQAVEKLGLPVAAKPDNGVGTAATFKLSTEADIQRFKNYWEESRPYFIESYVEDGTLCTYDGLIDKEGNIVFETSFIYNMPTLELLKGQHDMAYVIQKNIEPKLREYGRAIVKEFGMKERFFHIEFFKMKEGDYTALEYNNRLTGGYTVDMYNFSHSIDLFKEYAAIVTGGSFEGSNAEVEYCVGVTQRDRYHYKHYAEDIYKKYGEKVKYSGRIPEAFANLQGNHFYAINADTEEEVGEIIKFVHEKQIQF